VLFRSAKQLIDGSVHSIPLHAVLYKARTFQIKNSSKQPILTFFFTDSEDKKKEDMHVEEATRTCGYPEWSFRKVKRQLKTVQKKKAKQQHTSVKRPLVVIPYAEHISEVVARTLRKYDIHVAT